ncbi:MAG: hypothetical protein LBG65_07585 [Puniceicoccales bacterium]|nr:hypothetical protein [Puniceicoccales bacterium]
MSLRQQVQINGEPDIFWGVGDESLALDTAISGFGFITNISDDASLGIDDTLEDAIGITIATIKGNVSNTRSIDLVMRKSATLPEVGQVVSFRGNSGTIDSVKMKWGNKEKGACTLSVSSKGAVDYTQSATITSAT